MANAVLFRSAWFVTLVHFLWIVYVWPVRLDLVGLYAAGLATSVWNHGTTSVTAQWCDRVLMGICTVYNAWLSHHHVLPAACLLASVTCYGVAKVLKATPVHVAAHLFVTVTNCVLCVVVREDACIVNGDPWDSLVL